MPSGRRAKRSDDSPAHHVRRRERLVLAALTSTMVLLVLDSSIVGVMLPTMTRDLQMTRAGGAWVVSIYLLTLAVCLPLGGRLADAFGSVTMFRIGMVGFILASAGIAAIPDVLGVVGCRAAAGVAAALLMPATLSLLMQAIAEGRRAAAMAIYTGVGQGFAIVGPAIGGVCAEFLGWQWGFLINVPVGVAGLAILSVARPRNIRRPVKQWDLLGLVLLVVGVSVTMTALLQAPDRAWGPAAVLVALSVGAVALFLFVRHARSVKNPILDISLAFRPDFSVNALALFCLGFAMTVATVYGASALQDALDLGPAMAGLTLLPLVVPLLVTTRTVAARYEELGLRRVVVVGSCALACGLAIIAAGFATSSVVVVAVAMIPAGAGIGAIMSPLTAAAVGAAPADLRGQAAGLVTTSRQIGGVVGIAAFAACAAAISGSSGIALGFLVSAAVMALAAAASYRVLPTEPGPP